MIWLGRRGIGRWTGRSTPRGRWQAALRAGVVLWCGAEALAAQEGGPAYHPLQLDCARYRQEIHSSIVLEGSGTRSRERTGRDGLLTVRATPSDSGIALLAWFDSLGVWREGSGERLAPSTDGLIGGRYRGFLSPAGDFRSTDRPFVPDDVAQVADVGDALERLLPRLPARRLDPGESWRTGDGTVITRLSDAVTAGRVAERYRLTVRFEGEDTRLLPDSTPVRAHRTETETGVYEWRPEVGVVRWERSVTIEVVVPAGGVVKRAFRTRIEQQAVTARDQGGCPDP